MEFRIAGKATQRRMRRVTIDVQIFSAGIHSVGSRLDKSQLRRAVVGISRIMNRAESAHGWERQGMIVLRPLLGFKCRQQVVVQTEQKCSSCNRW